MGFSLCFLPEVFPKKAIILFLVIVLYQFYCVTTIYFCIAEFCVVHLNYLIKNALSHDIANKSLHIIMGSLSYCSYAIVSVGYLANFTGSLGDVKA